MAKLLKQLNEENHGFNFPSKSEPLQVIHFKNRSKVSQLKLSNNVEINSACILCANQSCMKLEASQNVFASLEASQTDILCPTNSIKVKENELTIDENCIHCGLCVSACPIGAIFFNEDGKIEVNRPDENYIPINQRILINTDDIKVSDEYPFQSENIIKNVISNLKLLTYKNSIINKLVVKSFESIGLPSNLTRSGDVNLRMDALSKKDNIYYPIEIELVASLDSPRDILDDVAVFCSRHNVSKQNIVGIIVLAELPNKRSEYWELLSDIEKTIELKIATIPLSALLISMWNQTQINIEDFYLNKYTTSAREAVNKIIGMKVEISKNSSLLEASK